MPGWVKPSSGPDDVHDPAGRAVHTVQTNAELPAVFLHLRDLASGQQVDGSRARRSGGCAVVHRRHRLAGPAQLQPALTQALKSLG